MCMKEESERQSEKKKGGEEGEEFESPRHFKHLRSFT